MYARTHDIYICIYTYVDTNLSHARVYLFWIYTDYEVWWDVLNEVPNMDSSGCLNAQSGPVVPIDQDVTGWNWPQEVFVVALWPIEHLGVCPCLKGLGFGASLWWLGINWLEKKAWLLVASLTFYWYVSCTFWIFWCPDNNILPKGK